MPAPACAGAGSSGHPVITALSVSTGSPPSRGRQQNLLPRILRFNCQTAKFQTATHFVIPGRRVCAGPGIQSDTPCLHLWIPGSLAMLAPRNHQGVGMRHRPYSKRARVSTRVIWRRRVRRRLFSSPRQKPEGMERRAAHQSSVLPRSLLENAGASRRSIGGDFCPRVRVSWFPSGLFGAAGHNASSAVYRLVPPKPLNRLSSPAKLLAERP